MMDMARRDLAVLGISFIGCGMALGIVLGAIGAAGPLSPAQADQLWMMSFGLLFVIVIGAAFVLLILAPSNILWRHVFDPSEEANVRVLFALMLPVPNFFVYRLIEAV